MAFLEMRFFSEALGTCVSVNVILPEQAKSLIGMRTRAEENYKTLYLFHGLSDDHSIWMRRTSIERYAAMHGIAVVMPNAGRSWYTDTAYGANYFTFVTEELPNICRSYFRGMSDKREDNLVAGLSMGGYGAVKAAMSCPDRFGGCASLSGALDVTVVQDHVDSGEWKGIFGYDLQNSTALAGTEHDAFHLARKNHAAGMPFPKMYIWCGEDDFLLEDNRRFHALLEEMEIPHRYVESEGNHDWKWWDLHIQSALNYLLGD